MRPMLLVFLLYVMGLNVAAQPKFDRSDSDDKPFLLNMPLPEGNYDVSVTFGHDRRAAGTTVRAEQRQLMLENIRTEPGATLTRTFTVNIRRPEIAGGGRVALKAREASYPRWDDRLTLEFAGAEAAVRSVRIQANPDALTVFLAGDSTVADQPNEPYNSWGQMLPRFFKEGVAVANHAESGESLRSFLNSRRWAKVLSCIRKGDYVLIQFGHNDQKDKTAGAGAHTTYAGFLRQYIGEARQRGATVILVTPVSRRSFNATGRIASNLGDFPDAVRAVARELDAPLIDLNAMSQRFYEAMGVEKSKLAFAPGDNSHHNNYGSYEIARCVVEGIRVVAPDLAKRLADDAGRFDPARPDPVEAFTIPVGLVRPAGLPEGN